MTGDGDIGPHIISNIKQGLQYQSEANFIFRK